MTPRDPDLAGGHFAARIIARVGTPRLGPTLDDALRTLAAFDLSAILRYPDGARPILLHDGLGGVSPPDVMEAYLDGTYLLDAVYAACRRRVPEGLYRLSQLAPDEFFQGDYFNSPLVHPCISMQNGALAEEIAFLVAFPEGDLAAYSLMRSNGRPPFDDDEIGRLSACAPIVGAAILRQWGGGTVHDAPRSPPPRDDDAIEEAFLTFGAPHLSTREQGIVRLVLRGHSSASIALVLGIAEGTVKNHRKHIHAKLGVSSQAELFAQFVRHLRGAG